MKFTVVFEGNESVDPSFGLCFIPCPVWMRGAQELLNLHPERPNLQPGAVGRLRSLPSLCDEFKSIGTNVTVVAHPLGCGTDADLQVLLADLAAEGFIATVVTPRARRAQPTRRATAAFEPLTDAELEIIVRNISEEIAIEQEYDYTKYPADVLTELRQTFADPAAVNFPVVEKALKWKYGHINKANYPGHQRDLARKIAELWPTAGIRPGTDATDAFDRWQDLLPTGYITVCFLLHLVNPDTMPILDQHNYRSVSNHLSRAGRTVISKPAPRGYSDLLLVRDFSAAVRDHWTKVTGEPAPDAGRLDRYLMMHGKALKSR